MSTTWSGCWRPEQEAESLQAFNSDYYQKQREEKILSKISALRCPDQVQRGFFPRGRLHAVPAGTNACAGGKPSASWTFCRSAFNYLDEDPRQEMGQLDLPAVIQAMASNKPATDVFVLDEYLKPSFAWSLIFDVSNSMQVKGEYGRALAIAVAEAAKELMIDATSWTFFGFNDKLLHH